MLEHGIIVVTEAESGIGYQTAEYLARHFSYVVYAAVKNEEDVQRFEQIGLKNLRPITLDVIDHASCQHLVETIKEHMQKDQLPLVAVVHNAASSHLLPAEFHPLQDVRTLFEANLFGVIDLVQLTLPLLRENKGRMVFLSSFATCQPMPLSSIYCATKSALESFSDALRREVDAFGISVSILKPGFVQNALAKKDDFINDELIESSELKDELKHIYKPYFSKECKDRYMSLIKGADKPLVVTKKIVHAIVDPYPKTRYYVGNVNGIPTRLLAILAWIQGDRFQDCYLSGK